MQRAQPPRRVRGAVTLTARPSINIARLDRRISLRERHIVAGLICYVQSLSATHGHSSPYPTFDEDGALVAISWLGQDPGKPSFVIYIDLETPELRGDLTWAFCSYTFFFEFLRCRPSSRSNPIYVQFERKSTLAGRWFSQEEAPATAVPQ
ncbi:hypothetical protein B0H14DRAFT_2763361 [Mycena olivaceomarginata]|nr:hypothetical protein B0H14DRAFT_2763361 [Mycena olivaceomarginata]